MVRATTEVTEVEKGGHMLLEKKNWGWEIKSKTSPGLNESMRCPQESGFAGVWKWDLNWPLELPEHLCTVSHLTTQSDRSYRRDACQGREASWRKKSWPALKDGRSDWEGEAEDKHTALCTRRWETAGLEACFEAGRWSSPFWLGLTLGERISPFGWESALGNTKMSDFCGGIHYWVILEFWLVIMIPVY